MIAEKMLRTPLIRSLTQKSSGHYVLATNVPKNLTQVGLKNLIDPEKQSIVNLKQMRGVQGPDNNSYIIKLKEGIKSDDIIG